MTGDGNASDGDASTGIDRRTALRAGGGLLAAGVAGSTAGCLDALPISNPLGGSGYATWLYDPGTVSARDHYDFFLIDGMTVAKHEDAFASGFYDQVVPAVENETATVDLDIDEVSTHLQFSNSLVVQGEYTTEDVVGELEDNGFTADDTYQGYELYEQTGVAWGVGGDALVRGRATDTEDGVAVVEATVDTNKGEEDRYVDEVAEMDTLVGRLGRGTLEFGGTSEATGGAGPFADTVAGGLSVTVEGDRSTLKRVAVYADADDYDKAAIEGWIDDHDGSGEAFDDVDDVRVNTESNAVVIKGKVATEDLGTNHLQG